MIKRVNIEIRKLWDLGLDTQDIAERLKIKESQVYKTISRRRKGVLPAPVLSRAAYAGSGE